MTGRMNTESASGTAGMLWKGGAIPMPTELKPGIRRYFAKIGRKGGLVKSESKAQAVRKNGLRGGRPKKAVPLAVIETNPK